MLSLILATSLVTQGRPEPLPGPGVSEALARHRAESIRSVRYDLAFTIPPESGSPVLGRVILRFSLAAAQAVVIDFSQPGDRVRRVNVSGTDARVSVVQGHLVIPASLTRAGENEVLIEFLAGDEPLNRNPEFLYTLFVPARAQRAFPCFDQPDLKARYTLSLDLPAGWVSASNGIVAATDITAGGTRVRFAETQPLPTYLFSFVAGKFSIEAAVRNGRSLRLLHRETDAAKVARNRDAIFDLHAAALAWLEDYTAIPYPFGKFDIVAIPSFQFGGMEHPGAILYNAASLLLDESATQNQMLDRASVIAHETSHMWFGDLVTMRWFNDVWMKEVFANFMAGKIVNPSFPQVNHDLRFLLSNYPAAYQVDRTAGTNAIRQPLANLDEAGQLYGAIIYQKAPVVMRQLELIVGEGALREGLREYLSTYAMVTADVEYTSRVQDLVHEGFDLAIRVGPILESRLVARPLGELEYGLFACPRYLALRGRPENVDQLRQHGLVMFTGGAQRRGWHLLPEGGTDRDAERIDGPARLRVNNSFAVRDALKRGLGIGLLPLLVAADAVEAQALVSVMHEWRPLPVPVHAVYPSNRYLSPKVRAFIDLAIARFPQDNAIARRLASTPRAVETASKPKRATPRPKA